MYTEQLRKPITIICDEDSIEGGNWVTISGKLATNTDTPVFYYPLSGPKVFKGDAMVCYGYGSIVRVKNVEATTHFASGDALMVGTGGTLKAIAGKYIVAIALEDIADSEYGFVYLTTGENVA